MPVFVFLSKQSQQDTFGFILIQHKKKQGFIPTEFSVFITNTTLPLSHPIPALEGIKVSQRTWELKPKCVPCFDTIQMQNKLQIPASCVLFCPREVSDQPNEVKVS